MARRTAMAFDRSTASTQPNFPVTTLAAAGVLYQRVNARAGVDPVLLPHPSSGCTWSRVGALGVQSLTSHPGPGS